MSVHLPGVSQFQSHVLEMKHRCCLSLELESHNYIGHRYQAAE